MEVQVKVFCIRKFAVLNIPSMLRYDVQILSLVHVYCVQRTMAMGIANLASVCPKMSKLYLIS